MLHKFTFLCFIDRLGLVAMCRYLQKENPTTKTHCPYWCTVYSTVEQGKKQAISFSSWFTTWVALITLLRIGWKPPPAIYHKHISHPILPTSMSFLSISPSKRWHVSVRLPAIVSTSTLPSDDVWLSYFFEVLRSLRVLPLFHGTCPNIQIHLLPPAFSRMHCSRLRWRLQLEKLLNQLILVTTNIRYFPPRIAYMFNKSPWTG
jgi:hypothetical protein